MRQAIVCISFVLLCSIGIASATGSNMVFGIWPHTVDIDSGQFTGYHPDWESLTHIAYAGIDIYPNGTIDVTKWDENTFHNISTNAAANRVKVIIVVTPTDTTAQGYTALLDTNRATATTNIANLLSSKSADGICMDFEGIIGNNGSMFLFSKMLHEKMDAIDTDSELSPCINMGIEDCYRNESLAAFFDYVLVMDYDYHYVGSDTTGPITYPADDIDWWITDIQNYYNMTSVVYVLPMYGIEWKCDSASAGAATNLTGTGYYERWMYQAKQYAASNFTHTYNDGTLSSPWYHRQSDGVYWQCWYVNETSLQEQIDWLYDTKNVHGFGFWALGYEGTSSDILSRAYEKVDGDFLSGYNNTTVVGGVTGHYIKNSTADIGFSTIPFSATGVNNISIAIPGVPTYSVWNETQLDTYPRSEYIYAAYPMNGSANDTSGHNLNPAASLVSWYPTFARLNTSAHITHSTISPINFTIFYTFNATRTPIENTNSQYFASKAARTGDVNARGFAFEWYYGGTTANRNKMRFEVTDASGTDSRAISTTTLTKNVEYKVLGSYNYTYMSMWINNSDYSYISNPVDMSPSSEVFGFASLNDYTSSSRTPCDLKNLVIWNYTNFNSSERMWLNNGWTGTRAKINDGEYIGITSTNQTLPPTANVTSIGLSSNYNISKPISIRAGISQDYTIVTFHRYENGTIKSVLSFTPLSNLSDSIIQFELPAGNYTDMSMISTNQNATASMDGNIVIIATGLLTEGDSFEYEVSVMDEDYSEPEIPVSSIVGFVNVPAVQVTIVGAAFVGASFVGAWYRRRHKK